ncbi:putative acetyltransferase [Kingella potus]|uniref:Putative acetyltransferase n=1 Tax=Kingella potus TaxID=265175 RepID=A0A377QZD0_9NEIS|nr:GNAT family N-acetyltransferase [Kingella potus]UOP01575.1 GNAT family N-acetyltransferase [Kingella potus]STR00135.1 putative acetyltransferase [Kingella potus]
MAILTVLRPAVPADCADIHHVHEYAVQYTCRKSYDQTVLEAWSALLAPESYLETLADPKRELWVAEFKGHIQGFVQIDLKEAQLDALYVHPFVHNQGLGTALLHKAEERAASAGFAFLKLYASTNSVSFYLLNGYDSLGKAVLPLNRTVKVECELMRKRL